MKKKTLLVIGLLLAATAASAQLANPVKWTFAARKAKDNVYEVRMEARIQPGWSMYSQGTPDGGPFPTKVTFGKNTNVLYGGKVREAGQLKKKYEEVFGVDVHYYTDSVTFVQLVKRKQGIPTTLSGTVEFMACDAEQCLPPEEVAFAVELR